MARKAITVLNGATKTEKAVFSEPAFGGPESMTPDWDRYAGNQQGMSRAKVRADMGKKKTPIGRGTLCCSRK